MVNSARSRQAFFADAAPTHNRFLRLSTNASSELRDELWHEGDHQKLARGCELDVDYGGRCLRHLPCVAQLSARPFRKLCTSFPRSLTCISLCTLADMPLDGCAPGAAGPGDDSPVVWGRVRSFSPLAHDTLPAVAPCHSQGLLCCAHAVFALLPPDVHHDMAAQQKHMPNLPPKVGVCICTQAGPGDAWDPAAWRGICSSRSGRTRRRLSFMGRDLSAGPLSGVALMSSARAGERCRDSPMRRSHYIISRPYAGYPDM